MPTFMPIADANAPTTSGPARERSSDLAGSRRIVVRRALEHENLLVAERGRLCRLLVFDLEGRRLDRDDVDEAMKLAYLGWQELKEAD